MKINFCECTICVYNEDRECLLDEVSIGALGECADCLHPTIPDDELEKYKQIAREKN